MKRFLFAAICVLLLGSCSGDITRELVLFDFEKDDELNGIHWKCRTLISLSDEYPTHGKKSLKLELFPSEYPGLHPILEEHDWRKYGSVCFDVFNPQKKVIRITVRVDDQEDTPPYQDRYNKSFSLNPGMNEMRIPLRTLLTTGTGRALNLVDIQRFLIFMVRPKEKVVLYMDYLRLERFSGNDGMM